MNIVIGNECHYRRATSTHHTRLISLCQNVILRLEDTLVCTPTTRIVIEKNTQVDWEVDLVLLHYNSGHASQKYFWLKLGRI